MATTRRTVNKGLSLARGPALALGAFLVVAGLYFIYMEHGFPRLSAFPNGTAHQDGKAFFGLFGLNGWSGELTVAGGALLMLGAAQHTLAKTVSFVVAVVFAGVGIWALANHHSALGLFAANIWTILLWFAAAAYLLINTLMPRAGGPSDDEIAAARIEPVIPNRRAAAPAPAGDSQPTTASTDPTSPAVTSSTGTDSADVSSTATDPATTSSTTTDPTTSEVANPDDGHQRPATQV